MTRPWFLFAASCVAALLLTTAGCMKKPPAAPPAASVEVKVVTVEASPTVMYADKVGEVKGSQEVDIRSMVSGILLKKHFDDGTMVTKGQLLYSVDPREFLAQVAAARQTEAQVTASRAALDQTRLGVEYAQIRAPLTGRIGAVQIFPGDLVTAGQTLLGTISSDDPAWVYFQISETEFLAFIKRHGSTDPPADDPVQGFAFHVRGGKLAAAAIAEILGKLGARAFDPAADNGLFDIVAAGASLQRWQQYRDSVTRTT